MSSSEPRLDEFDRHGTGGLGALCSEIECIQEVSDGRMKEKSGRRSIRRNKRQ